MAQAPTAFEQAILEYINQARMNPAGEFDVAIADAAAGTGTQSNITSAIRYFGVDIEAYRTQMQAYSPVAPLAWNSALATAADSHSQLMIDTDTQSHNLPGELGLGARITAAGYTGFSRVGENIFAYTKDPLYGHAGFMIDWGYDDADRDANGALRPDWQTIGDGMQDKAGHRNAILSANYVDIGISALEDSSSATSVGPWVVTQNFGAVHGTNPAQLVGVLIDDADGDAFYDIGEGLGGVTVTATGSAGTFTTTTWASGGYQMELAAGTYRVEFSGGPLAGVAEYEVTMGSANTKLDGYAADAVAFGPNVVFADGLEALHFPEISAQVYRLYQAVLGRAPDQAGHLAWIGRLALEGRALDSVVQGFMGSPEFQTRFGGKDNAEFVTLLYDNVLGRAPDALGLANWTARLDGGMSRAEVVRGFSESFEFRTETAAAARAFGQGNSPSVWSDDVYRLYRATLDREPDLTGFENWAERLGSGTSYLEVADGFVRSPQFKATYAEGLDATGFITLLYDNVLNRAPDANGLANWAGRMDAGMTRAEVVRGFAQSAEFVAATAQSVMAWIRAQGVDDVIEARVGENLLAGGMRTDSFVFTPGGIGTVLDLEPWDLLDLTAFGFASDTDARDRFTQAGPNVLFDDGAGTFVTLLGTTVDVLTDEMILV